MRLVAAPPRACSSLTSERITSTANERIKRVRQLRDGAAEAVEFEHFGIGKVARANREVVLAAGIKSTYKAAPGNDLKTIAIHEWRRCLADDPPVGG